MADAPKLTTAEALDHARGLVTKFAKPLLRLEEILTAAASAEEVVKAKSAEADTLSRQLESARTELASLSAQVQETRHAAIEERTRADAAIANAKAEQARAEREATESVARVSIRIQEREAQSEQEHSRRVAAMNGEIASLQATKTELERFIKTAKEKFQ